MHAALTHLTPSSVPSRRHWIGPVRVLDALELTPLLSSPPTLSHLTNLAKPDRQIFELACARAGVEADEALMVGDELEASVVSLCLLVPSGTIT